MSLEISSTDTVVYFKMAEMLPDVYKRKSQIINKLRSVREKKRSSGRESFKWDKSCQEVPLRGELLTCLVQVVPLVIIRRKGCVSLCRFKGGGHRARRSFISEVLCQSGLPDKLLIQK